MEPSSTKTPKEERSPAEAIDTTTDNANRGEVTNRGPKVEGLTITIQQKTWLEYMNRSGNKDITLQFKKVYSGTVHPFAGRFTIHMLQHWHAKPTMLNLIFSHTGEWVRILNIPNTDGGPNYFNFSIGRRERYIDEDGVIRSAVAYGDEDIKLTIWFDMEEMTRCLVKWVLPEVPFYWNSKKWKPNLRNHPNQEQIFW